MVDFKKISNSDKPRERLYEYGSENLSNEELYNKLLAVDPNTEIHINNRKRVERALNYYEQNKKPFSSKEKSNKELFDAVYIGLTTEREVLYERINKRVDNMEKIGLIDEAQRVFDSNIRTKAVLTPIGYKELFPYFENKDTLLNCLDKIKHNSRRYAKRQYTWFNNQMNIEWFDVDFNDFSNTINNTIKIIPGIK